MQQEITVLALDFGNVLGTFDHMRACRAIAYKTDMIPEQVYTTYFGNDAETRRLVGETDSVGFYSEVSKNFGLRGVSYEEFKDIWGDIFSPAPNEVVHTLFRVRCDVRMLLVSNTEELHWMKIRDLPSVRPFFPVAYQALSFRLGVRKPDREYYRRALDRIGARTSEVLYVDDVPEYVDVFRGMGGQGEVFDLNKHTPEYLIDILSRYGLLK